MIIDAALTAAHQKASASEADALVFFVVPEPAVPEWFATEEPELGATLAELIRCGEVTGKKGNVVILHALDRPYRRVVTVGLGKDPKLLDMMNRFADMHRDLREKGFEHFTVVLPDYLFPGETPEAIARGLGGAGTISAYEFQRFMNYPDVPRREFRAELITRTTEQVEAVREAGQRGVDLGQAVVFSRDLCNLPGNIATPEYMATQAQTVAEESEGALKATVLGPAEMELEGMNLLLAVAKGAEVPPRMICLDYDGAPGNPDRVVVVGKSVTFDAGGITIKPGKGMMEMKRDKMGGTNVLGLARCIGRWRPELNVSFVISAAENMPDGRAYRPGDCYQAMNGKWVEIISTDAEGRLVMADAISWAQKYRSPRVLIDMATLTGGAQLALGGGMIAAFSNHEGLWGKIARASASSREDLWRLPLYQSYKKGVRSYFAETKNSSTTPPSTIKAALFLEEWIDPGVQWAHLDIAASMSVNRPSGILTRGATGMGLVLVADILDLYAREGFDS